MGVSKKKLLEEKLSPNGKITGISNSKSKRNLS